MPKLFISYPMTEKDLAVRLASELREVGNEVVIFTDWIGEAAYRQRYIDVLETCDGIVAVITGRFAGSPNLRREVGEALVYRDRRGSPQVIPVVFEGELPSDLQATQAIVANRENLKEAASAVSVALSQAMARTRVRQQEREKIQGRLERNAAEFVKTSLKRLTDREVTYRTYALANYTLAGAALLFGIAFAVWRFGVATSLGDKEWVHLARLVVAGIFVVGLASGFARFAFTLGKSYMVEALRNAERAHAISFGEFYLNAFGEQADWAQVQEAFKNWNIDVGSAFHAQSVKDIDPEIMSTLQSIAAAAARSAVGGKSPKSRRRAA